MLGHAMPDKLGRGCRFTESRSGFRRYGVPIDRGTISRWLEEMGATIGATIV
jgi:hypothetical protein